MNPPDNRARVSCNEARLRSMLDRPGIYNFDTDDIRAIRWALALCDSIQAERVEMSLERAGFGRYILAVEDAVKRLQEIKP